MLFISFLVISSSISIIFPAIFLITPNSFRLKNRKNTYEKLSLAFLIRERKSFKLNTLRRCLSLLDSAHCTAAQAHISQVFDMKLASIFAITCLSATAGILSIQGSASAAALRGFYPLDGNGTDPTGFGPELTEPGQAVNYVSGLEGQAASFDGTGSSWLRADVNSSGNVNPTFSWGAWVKLNRPNAWNIFLSNDNNGWDRFTQVSDGKWSVSNGTGVQNSGAQASSEWTFVAQTFDGTQQKLYVDNQLVLTAQDNQNPSQPFIDIGRNANAAFPLNGLMDGVFLFDDVLTQEEVETIRVGGAGGQGVYEVAGLGYPDAQSTPEASTALSLLFLSILGPAALKRKSSATGEN